MVFYRLWRQHTKRQNEHILNVGLRKNANEIFGSFYLKVICLVKQKTLLTISCVWIWPKISFCCCNNTLWLKSNMEKEEVLFHVILPGHSPSSREIKEGIQAGTRAETVEQCLLTCSVLLSDTDRPHSLGMFLCTVDYTFSH